MSSYYPCVDAMDSGAKWQDVEKRKKKEKKKRKKKKARIASRKEEKAKKAKEAEQAAKQAQGGALAGFLGQWVFGTAFGIVALLAVYHLALILVWLSLLPR